MIRDRYFHREKSWLEFNRRVLCEAMDESNPILERLKFTGIVFSNLDEFFMVRVASIDTTDPQYAEVIRKAFDLMREAHEFFVKTLEPELEKKGIRRLRLPLVNEEQREYLRKFFFAEILSVLTPIAVREEEPAPILVNLSLYRVFKLRSARADGDQYAAVELPRNTPRMISLPGSEGYSYMLLEDLVSLFAAELFQGYEVVDEGVIRITREADLTLDEEKDEDFAKVMSDALRMRRTNRIVRFEVEAAGPLKDFFVRKLNVSEERIYASDGWLDIRGIAELAFQPLFPELKRADWKPVAVKEFQEAESVWDVIRQKDVLVHHPYDSFEAFSQFIAQAAEDPDVLAIKQTLYRAGTRSKVITALEKAAERGKQVTVLVELKARFDEKRNIDWAARLERAGATVLYGVQRLKTHAKACLVVRREVDGIRRYAHLSTGNYNEKTSELYTDLALFTSNDDICRDVTSFFNVITGFSDPVGFKKLEVAPFGLRSRLTRLIQREAMRSQKDSPGLILGKMNSLVDPELIDELYRASQAGVHIKLNVRGVCCLKPGVEGLSENIEVVSIVDMFLEHSRILYFANGGEDEIYLSSADWMPRNLDRRVEILFPIEDKSLKKEVLDLLKHYFRDNQKAWLLQPDGSYAKREAGTERRFRIQEYLIKKAFERKAQLAKPDTVSLKPQKPKEN